MKLIVGLGNPGKKYAYTRHNVGFLCLDKLVSRRIVSPHISKKLQAIYYVVHIPPGGSVKAILAKPQIFMNESGKVVRKLVSSFKSDLDDFILVHDDIDLKLGTYKIQKGRGSAGHKGVQSVIENLESKEFTRVRIGVGKPVLGIDPERYVLQKFKAEERENLEKVVAEVIKDIEKILTE